MSIFNTPLFLHDDPHRARIADAVSSSYAQGYGNRVASARVFAALGHARRGKHRNAGAPVRCSAVSATDPCPLRACG